MKKYLRCLPVVLLTLLALCLVSTGFLALDSRNYSPIQADTADRMDGTQAGYLEEVFHLKATLGDATWPGFGQASFPALVGNEAEIFLVGAQTAPEGWEALPASIVDQKPVFRRPANSLDGKLQAFVTQFEGRWVPSWYTYRGCANSILGWVDSSLPSLLQRVFPYRLFLRFFFPVQVYVTGWEHETFHAFEAQLNPQRFDRIQANYKVGNAYPVNDVAFNTAWEKEIDLLIRAVQEKSDAKARELGTQFLDQRTQRRQQASMSPQMVQFERDAEWLEGLAKYTELTIGKLAAGTPGYQPAAGVGFQSYSEMGWRYNQQVTEVRNHIHESSDGRFYYTGFLQAVLLDRLNPGWKADFLPGNDWLEDALSKSIQ